MKLDTSILKFLSKDEFRILTAIEVGMRNHQLVEFALIFKISKLNSSRAQKSLSIVHKHKLVFHDSKKCDGYRLTFLGYDYLALNTFVQRSSLTKVCSQIGVGKESDVFTAVDSSGRTVALKLHRLGRVSFKSVKQNRDYLQNRSGCNWLYISRIAAKREYDFMRVLWEEGFPIPKPLDWNRHCVLMEHQDGFLLQQVRELESPEIYHRALLSLAMHLAKSGFVHCDFNEFNVLLLPSVFESNGVDPGSEDSDISKGSWKFVDKNDFKKIGLILIDFPQMVSTSHKNASELFKRDIDCINLFFHKKFGLDIPEEIKLENVLPKDFVAGSEENSLVEKESELLNDLKRDRKALSTKVKNLDSSKDSVVFTPENIRNRLQAENKKKSSKTRLRNKRREKYKLAMVQ